VRAVHIHADEAFDSCCTRACRYEHHPTEGVRTAPLVIRKGDTFEMIAEGQEGGCRIRYAARVISLTCPWLPGFTDPQRDIFEMVSRVPHAQQRAPVSDQER
jgi:hypothetical protein